MTEIISLGQYRLKTSVQELPAFKELMALPKDELSRKLLDSLEELDHIKSMIGMFYMNDVPEDIREASGMNRAAKHFFESLISSEG